MQAALGLVLFSLVLLACTPPIDRDALIHHLQIPKLYLQHGGIYEIPELVFSYYPMNLDLLYMGALWLGSDILPKYIHMAFALATALLLFFHLQKRLPRIYAWLGVVFFLSIPAIVKLSITVYVDLGLVFFSTAALLLLFRWLETKRLRHLLFAGFCCGLGIGTKYNGLLVLFILAVMVPVLFIRSQQQQKGAALFAAKVAVFFCCAALLAASPLLIRNAIWTGNPIYPLYNGFFNRAAAPPAAEVAETGAEETKTKSGGVRGVFATRHVLYGENIWQLLLLPVRIFFHEAQDDDPRYFDGRLNPFLLLLPLTALLLLMKKADRQARLEQAAMAAFCLLYFLYAFNIEVLRIRYLVPMLPFLVILSMHGLHRLEVLAGTGRLAVTVWLLPVVLMLTWNGLYIRQQFEKIDPLSYLSGRLSRDEYLAKQIPEYLLLQHINTKLPESAKILCIFMGWRGYYINKPHWFDQHGNEDRLLAWLKQPGMTAEQIGQRLAVNGTSHLLIRRDLLYNQLRNEEISTQQLWVKLEQRHLLPLASHLYYTLYQTSF
ncbi:MAG: ArnT family glycosyltransferase [Candidatus Electronema sp. V4]|uniref:ArnT family glycosyltransferase n=1 Tax=Candidatus Electronema sp. V4 TaxID=3454756 RepID=UPI00405587D3